MTANQKRAFALNLPYISYKGSLGVLTEITVERDSSIGLTLTDAKGAQMHGVLSPKQALEIAGAVVRLIKVPA